MHTPDTAAMRAAIEQNARSALAEDIGDGDITAALIPEGKTAHARIISREPGVICGRDWVNEVFRQLDPGVKVTWHVSDGETVAPDRLLYELEGSARSLLTGERTALNFLQLLSGNSNTLCPLRQLVDGTGVKLLDTRKTVPGLRLAQKYAVSCGGCYNHRIGLFDAFLVKENHIEASGGIAAAITAAREIAPGKPVEVEVESLEEFEQALAAGSDRIMLDNFTLADLRTAVERNAGQAELEGSGGITEETVQQVAKTGVDYISIGTLTKDVVALDLSMRLDES